MSTPTPDTGNGAKASSITIFDGHVTYTYYLAPSHGKWSIQDLYDAARKVCGSPETPGVKVPDWEASTRERDEFASWWKEIESLGRDELLDKVNKLTAQRDEWKDVAANADNEVRAQRDKFAARLEDALSDKVIAEAQIAALPDDVPASDLPTTTEG